MHRVHAWIDLPKLGPETRPLICEKCGGGRRGDLGAEPTQVLFAPVISTNTRLGWAVAGFACSAIVQAWRMEDQQLHPGGIECGESLTLGWCDTRVKKGSTERRCRRAPTPDGRPNPECVAEGHRFHRGRVSIRDYHDMEDPKRPGLIVPASHVRSLDHTRLAHLWFDLVRAVQEFDRTGRVPGWWVDRVGVSSWTTCKGGTQ